MSESQHDSRYIEDDEGAVLVHCSCGWIGPSVADKPVRDEDPPYSWERASLEFYNHCHRIRMGLPE